MSIPSEICHNSVEMASPPEDEEELRRQLHEMKERERRMMSLLKTTVPERMEHDLRNVLNELMLLRALFHAQPGD